MPKSRTPSVTGHDDRGGVSCSYGFVYFDDDHRVGYTDGPEGLFRGGENWPEPRREHYVAAYDYLTKTVGITVAGNRTNTGYEPPLEGRDE